MACGAGPFIAVSLLAILSLHAAASDSIGQISTGNNTIIVNSSSTSSMPQFNGGITGYIYDTKGNGVPQAYIVLYKDGVRTHADPIFSGDGDDGLTGEYGFSGLEPGNYSVIAEIADGIQFYNGTAFYVLDINESTELNVTINGYVFTPWLKPTPTPTVEGAADCDTDATADDSSEPFRE